VGFYFQSLPKKFVRANISQAQVLGLGAFILPGFADI
jgi:hypothetical protein